MGISRGGFTMRRRGLSQIKSMQMERDLLTPIRQMVSSHRELGREELLRLTPTTILARSRIRSIPMILRQFRWYTTESEI